jgi:membrane-associated phospholipid phosphatase
MGYFSYYIISLGVPLYIYFKVSNKAGEKFGFIVICSFLIYYLFFIIFPSGGPQYYFIDWPQKLPDAYIFGPVMRTIKEYGEGSTAAFPSAHVSICLILVIGSIFYARNLLKIILPVAVVLVLSTVYIRAHYVIDVIAGILIAPISYLITSGIYEFIESWSEIRLRISEQIKRKIADNRVFRK